MKKILWLFVFLLGLFPFQSCMASSATAEIKGTDASSSILGTVTFTEVPEGLRVEAEVSGVPAGRHGFHIHEKGDCGDHGIACGGHFNPDGVGHGDLLKDGFAHAHAGDLGNIEVGPDGTGKLDKTFPGLTLSEGKYSVLGRSVILHEKEDDFGQPTGNAGGRIACGVIKNG